MFTIRHFLICIPRRDKGIVTAVKDQGQCGACWAFSVVECAESMNALKHGSLESLSVQQVTQKIVYSTLNHSVIFYVTIRIPCDATSDSSVRIVRLFYLKKPMDRNTTKYFVMVCHACHSFDATSTTLLVCQPCHFTIFAS